METYHKINSIFKRNRDTKKFTGEYSIPEFKYLANCWWTFTEKIDGTNIRIMLKHEEGLAMIIGGRTDNAQIPATLLNKINSILNVEKLVEVFGSGAEVCLFGEGYGAKIQKGGGNYIKDGVDFILFDVKIGNIWLKRSDVEDIAEKLNIKVVPVIGHGILEAGISLCQQGFNSTFGDFEAEGLVARPCIELLDRMGRRIITKIKCRDYK